jgi:hypothetical protein
MLQTATLANVIVESVTSASVKVLAAYDWSSTLKLFVNHISLLVLICQAIQAIYSDIK